MKNIAIILFASFFFVNCSSSFKEKINNDKHIEKNDLLNDSIELIENIDLNQPIKKKDKRYDSLDLVEIKKLVISVLKWSDSDNSFIILPVKPDEKDSILMFDHVLLKKNIDILYKTDFFTKGFISNYENIILTLDRKLKGKEFEFKSWLVGDLPIFCFANDINPWYLDQGYFSWEWIKIEPINESGDLIWKHGKLSDDSYNDWKNYRYNFSIERVDGKWKISYLEGFDYEQSIKGDGNCS